MKKTRHPMQPIIMDKDRVVRFKKNEIVRYLLDTHPHADLNELACMPFDGDDRVQFAQLIGYSVSGFGELPYVGKKEVAAADLEAEKIMKRSRRRA